KEDVPGFAKLRPSADFLREDGRVGQVHHDETLKRAYFLENKGPGNGPTPVMRDKGDRSGNAARAGRVDQPRHVLQQMIHVIGGFFLGPGAVAVAAQVWCPGGVAKFRKDGKLLAP